MSDDQPRSGSRWEPPAETRPLAADSPASPAPGSPATPSSGAATPHAAPEDTTPGADTVGPVGTPGGAASEASPTAAEATPFWRRRPSGLRPRNVRPKVAAGIAAVALVGATGGFVLGNAIDGDSMTPAGFSDGDGGGDRGFGHRDGDGDFGRGAPDGDFAPPPMPGDPGAAPGDSFEPGDEDVEPPTTDDGSTDDDTDGEGGTTSSTT